MNAPVLTYPFRAETSHALRDLSPVRLLKAATTDDGEEVLAGTEGTVVAVYAGGAAYEVEFQTGLATVEAAALAAI